MPSRTFVSERGRLIDVVVGEYISFRFPSELHREFYWIETDDWVGSNDYWKEHMEQKRWFTHQMTDFINESTKQHSDSKTQKHQ